MFQYACGRALALKNNTNLAVDPSPLYDVTPWKEFVLRKYALNVVFSIDPVLNFAAKRQRAIRFPYLDTLVNRYYPQLLGHVGRWHYVKEARYSFDAQLEQCVGDIYLDGYWQTEKYFKHYESTIRSDFTLKEQYLQEANVMAQEIVSSPSVCMHVRRGDYAHNQASRKSHNVVTPEFYERATGIVSEKVGPNLKVFVFSDDIPWCRDNLRLKVDHEFVDPDAADIEYGKSIGLMSLCKHFIIPNSTFSWWAAWLSRNHGKIVIAPAKWHNDSSLDTSDVTPESWIRI
jgi:hypothetical protein